MKFSFQRFYTAASSRSQRRSKEGGVVAMAAGGGSVGDANLRSYIDGNFVTLATEQTVEAHKNYAKGISMYGIPWEYDVERDAWTIKGNVIITKGLATYSTLKEDDVLSVFDGLPIDNETLQWQETENGKILVAVGGGSGGGLDEDKLKDYLEKEKYVTESWIAGKSYYNSETLTKSVIKTKLGISNWALESSKPSYAFSEITSKPTTLSGYGITNAYTKTEVDDNFLALTGGTATGNITVKKTGGATFWANNTKDWIGLQNDNNCGIYYVAQSPLPTGYASTGWLLGFNKERTGAWFTTSLAVGHTSANSSYKLYVNGATRIVGQLSTTTSSDRRLKENIKKVDVGKWLCSLGGAYTFEYIGEEVARDEFYSGTHVGFIYQNVKKSLLERMCIEREDGYGSLNYLHPDYLGLLGAAAINHEDRLAKLEKRVEQLEKE